MFLGAVAVVVSLFGVLTLSSCSIFGTDAEISYKDAEGGKALSRYEGNSTNDTFVIPDEVDGVPVVELLDFSVAASETLRHLTIGKNVKVISGRAFCGSVKLVDITVAEGNEHFVSKDGVLYTADMKELVCYPNERQSGGAIADSFVVPDSVERIGQAAFYSCNKLKSVAFGANVKEVGNNAFIKCTALESLSLNEGLSIIGDDAFSFCDAVKTLTLPSTLTKIGNYAFFSQESKLENFVTKCDLSKVDCGDNWKPTKNGMKSGTVEPTYAG